LPIEQFHNIIIPAISVSIKPSDPHHIDKLNSIIRKLLEEEHNIICQLDKESGYFLIKGLNFEDIELLINKIENQIKINIGIGEFNIRYQERILKKSKKFLTKSPNGRNNILLHVEPLDSITEKLILSPKIKNQQSREERANIISKEANWDKNEAMKIFDVYRGCILINEITGLQWSDKINNLLIKAFRDNLDEGVLAREPVIGIKISISDITIDEDIRNVTYGQITGMVFSALSLAILDADPHLFEPIHQISLTIPKETEELYTMEITKFRGKILSIIPEDNYLKIIAIIPTAEIFDLEYSIKKNYLIKLPLTREFLKFEQIPIKLEEKTILTIRERKGLPKELPSIKSWSRNIRKTIPHLKLMKDKIIATLEEQHVNMLEIPREYLSEFLDESVCDFFRYDLPRVSYMLEIYLKENEIKIQYDKTMVKFIKSNVIRTI